MKIVVNKVDLEMLLNGNAREQIIAAQRLREEITTNSQGSAIRSCIEVVVSNIGEMIEQIEDENLLSSISAELDSLVDVVELIK